MSYQHGPQSWCYIESDRCKKEVEMAAALPLVCRSFIQDFCRKTIVSKTSVLFAALFLLATAGLAREPGASAAAPLGLIPQPVSGQVLPGAFRFYRGTTLLVSPDLPEARQIE